MARTAVAIVLLLSIGSAQALRDRSMLQGDPCQNRGDKWWQCCVERNIDPQEDYSCPTPASECIKLDAEGCRACSSFHGMEFPCPEGGGSGDDAQDFGSGSTEGEGSVSTASVPSPAPVDVAASVLGGDCASTGPANWWPCCSTKPAGSDVTCPPATCSSLTAGYESCCAAKGGFPADPTCYVRSCYNMNSTSAATDSILESAMQSMAMAVENGTTVMEIAHSAFQQLVEVMLGTSAEFGSTVVP